MRNIDNAYNIIVPEFKIRTNSIVSGVKAVSLHGEDWLLISDYSGMITAVKVDATQATATIGGFNDNKEQRKRVVFMFMTDANTLFALGESGTLRKWTLT